MKISQIKITNLYNLYNYCFDLTQAENNVCLFTGPNGYGKTTLLQIISSLSKIDLLFFYTIPFDLISIIFDNNEELVVMANKKSIGSTLDTKNTFDFPSSIEFKYKTREARILNHLNFSLSKFLKIHPDPFYRNIDLSIIDEKFLATLKERLNDDTELYEKYAIMQNQEQILFLLQRMNVFFISAQRLFYIDTQDEHPRYYYRFKEQKKSSIENIVNSLQKLLENARTEYLLVAQKHDNNFIKRLLSSKREYTEEKYKDKAESLKKRLEEIHSFNMIDSVELLPYNQENKGILSTYLDDYEEKLESYSQIIKKLKLFAKIINEKQFANKRITFSPEKGLSVVTTGGKEINVNMLSSGEKNLLIMLYHFIFDVRNSSILLIDEPEISLHIAWQLQFLDDISKIAEIKNMQIILATHSPQIINNNWESCFDFYEYGNKRT